MDGRYFVWNHDSVFGAALQAVQSVFQSGAHYSGYVKQRRVCAAHSGAGGAAARSTYAGTVGTNAAGCTARIYRAAGACEFCLYPRASRPDRFQLYCFSGRNCGAGWTERRGKDDHAAHDSGTAASEPRHGSAGHAGRRDRADSCRHPTIFFIRAAGKYTDVRHHRGQSACGQGKCNRGRNQAGT